MKLDRDKRYTGIIVQYNPRGFGFIKYNRDKRISFYDRNLQENLNLKNQASILGLKIVFSLYRNRRYNEIQATRITRLYFNFPSKVLDIIWQNGAFKPIDNFSLKLNHFIPFEKEEVQKLSHRFHKSEGLIARFNYQQLLQRQEQTIQTITKGNFATEEMEQDWRIAIGLGTSSVYETSMTLHHIYGIPFLPASAIKGVLRSYIIFSEFQNNEGLAIHCKEFCILFGCPKEIRINDKKYDSYDKKERQGCLLFLDSYPVHEPSIELDVMTPHYQSYYDGTYDAPVDYDKVNPISFLTLSNTSFQFTIGSNQKFNIQTEKFRGSTIFEWLHKALSEKGIGAKTAVGYGFMK